MLRLALCLFLSTFLFSLPAQANEEQASLSQVEAVAAFARLYGHIRYFHPSDEAAALDWSLFAIHGSEQIMQANSLLARVCGSGGVVAITQSDGVDGLGESHHQHFAHLADSTAATSAKVAACTYRIGGATVEAPPKIHPSAVVFRGFSPF